MYFVNNQLNNVEIWGIDKGIDKSDVQVVSPSIGNRGNENINIYWVFIF